MGDLMKIQTREYIEFIKNFTDSSSIMTKSFFVVIPYSPPILQTKDNFMGKLLGKKPSVSDDASKQKIEDFEEHRSQLEQRMSVVEQGLVRSGVRTVQLGTEEIIELYYRIFNPGDMEKPIQLT
jgi:hypothetical protein